MSANNTANKTEYTDDEKHLHKILGGYKAALSNPKSSEEAKKHAKEMLEKLGKGENVESERTRYRAGQYTEDEKHLHHIEGGYKATLSNPKSSEEAKKLAEEMLEKISKGEELPESEHAKYPRGQSEEEKHRHRIEGGYKATLSNEKSSEEAKKRAQEMLDKLSKGEELPESERTRYRSGQYTEEEKHLHRIEGGYKATLSNPKSSEEAKKKAEEMLEKISKGEHIPESESARYRSGQYSDEEKHLHRIEGGYKATLSNPKTSEEARKHAEEMLEKISKGEELPESEHNKYRNGELTEEEKHRHHVEGGYKATLSNEKSSEEAKKYAQEMLDKLSKGEELPESERTKNYASYNESREKEDNEKRGLKRSSEDAENESSGKGKQGFASMPHDKVVEIASKGGRTTTAGEEPSPKKGKTNSGKATEHKEAAPQKAK